MEFNFINILGIIFVVILLIPNIVYAVRFPNVKNQCRNRVMNGLEQIGRYASLALMVFPLGVWKFGFSNVTCFLLYLFGDGLLLLAYWIVWIFYFRQQSLPRARALAALPTAVFLLSGIMLGHWLLVAAAVIFGIGHLYVTDRNHRV